MNPWNVARQAPLSMEILQARILEWVSQFSSVTQSCPTLRPHESQHPRPPCPSPTPGVHSLKSIESMMPSSHLILCCPLLLLPPIPPASESFPMSQLFASGGQSTGVSALASFLPKSIKSFCTPRPNFPVTPGIC